MGALIVLELDWHEVFAHPYELFFDPSQRLSLLYMGTALIAAIGVYIFNNVHDAENKKSLLAWLFPHEVLTHASTRADIWMFLINKSIIVALFGAMMVGASFWADGLESLLPEVRQSQTTLVILIFTTLGVVMAMDFALWFGHYIFHKLPILWEFHKVHHSAEVMTPITAVRMHPVEEFVSAFLGAVGITVAWVTMRQFFGTGAFMFGWYGNNIVMVMFFLAAFNLRHSHVWLPYPHWLQHVFVSPAQHQIHHSRARKHWDKNMGFIFAFWDWGAGTLYSPRTKENIQFGLGNGEDGTWNSPISLYFRPFKNAWELIRKGPRAMFFHRKPARRAKSAMSDDGQIKTGR